MKKWIIVAMIAVVAASVQAASPAKGQSKEEYVNMMKKWMEKNGKTFNQATIEARFTKMDTNNDGVLTTEEKDAARNSANEKNAE